ncbi:MAG: diacylglycerol kinase family lipid kinase [Oscillospiraceae bacterium]|nr:diacylglycerol kinase family lipid kinase [Oscillospiraceae bacterium]
MKKLLFVYNPHSGKGMITNHLPEIIDIFTKGGYDVTAHPTQSRGDACSTVKNNASEYDLVVVSGGDGTTNEVIKGIMDGGHHVPVGSIPAGTMNDFATSLGIPKYMPDAARNIVNGKPRFVDVGAFNEQYFTYVAAFGVFTKVSYSTDQDRKNAFGITAYLVDAVKEAINNYDLSHSYNVTIKVGGKTVTDDFMFGMVANSLSVGGIKELAGNDVSMNDGLFEGIFIKNPANLAELTYTFNCLIKKDFNASCFYYFKAADFEVTSNDIVPWTVDGEFGGNDKHISLCCMHNALQMIVGSYVPGLKNSKKA